MPQRLTDSAVRLLPLPDRGNRIAYDTGVKGFGLRVTAAGARAFILTYRTRAGRERRLTIGSWPDWRTADARTEAAELKRLIDRGGDPLADLEAEREASTVDDLCARYEAEHLPRKRVGSQVRDRGILAHHVRPSLHHRKVRDVTFGDIDHLHRRITAAGKPIAANRTLGLLSKMFALAVRWGWRTDNPARGVSRNPEVKRTRYLTSGEIGRLTAALADHPDRQAAAAISFLLLTGARCGEALAATWDQFDLVTGIWTKPAAVTKQKLAHRVPLSAPARQLLEDLRAEACDSRYVFPGRGGHRTRLDTAWRTVCKVAGIRDARVHDLRHTYASLLVSSGLSLPVIGALLGHTQPATTHRYAHLFDDPLRAATERVGAIVVPKGDA